MDNQTGKTLAIVGGGAAGLAAAIAAADEAHKAHSALEIVVFERDERVGRSILVTGNGRCNFSNAELDVREYRNFIFVKDVLCALSGYACMPDRVPANGSDALIGPVHDFFAGIGLEWREETDGREYPLANKASVVVDVLRAAARARGVREACGNGVRSVTLPREQGKPFTLHMEDGAFQRADAVIIACGGRALDQIAVEGVTAQPAQPVLGPLRVSADDVPIVRELDNIRVKCTVSLARPDGDGWAGVSHYEHGELMFRKYGLSGICVFNLSRFAQPGDIVRVNLLPFDDQEEAADYVRERIERLQARFGEGISFAEVLRGLVLPRVADAFLKANGCNPDARCSADDAFDLACALTFTKFDVEGIGDADQCQVRRGGFDVADFDARTMRACAVPGLYAAGEALDVDGPCGGYNLHWAWSSGLLAGRSAAEALCGAKEDARV